MRNFPPKKTTNPKEKTKEKTSFKSPVIAVTCPLCGPTTIQHLAVGGYVVFNCGCKWYDNGEEWKTEK